MKLFKQDFVFTEKMREALQKKLKVYQTRKALQEMKEYDKIGTIHEPLKLLFIKYMIDTNQHQGLYNLVDVLGKRFYILNDIDKINKPIYIELDNSKKTGYQWQITILKGK